jgi:DNA replication protein DnaC
MTNTKNTYFCDLHGEVVGRRCETCHREYLEQQDREDAIKEARRRLMIARVPPRFEGKTFETFEVKTPEQKDVLGVAREYVQHFPANYKAGRCLIFLGGVGTGKTHLANAIIQRLIDTEHPSPDTDRVLFYTAKYATAAEIIQRIRDTWRRDAKFSTEEVVERFAGVDLLVIDEIGGGVGTDNERALLFEVLDLRYRTTRPTLVISNCGREGLILALGARAMDRLCENGGGVLCVFDWESHRK